MIGLDTNVLLRFLLKDDQQQWEIADRTIRQLKAEGEICYVNQIVLCQLIWVLKQSYKVSRKQLVAIVEDLLKSDIFEIENSDLVRAATKQFANSQADFADCLIGKINQNVAVKTLTFDRKLANLSEFQLLNTKERI